MRVIVYLIDGQRLDLVDVKVVVDEERHLRIECEGGSYRFPFSALVYTYTVY